MRVLAISDKVEPILYSPSVQERVGDVDLIVSCGDLPAYYVEFVVSMLNRPAYFVFGNHGYGVEISSNGQVVHGPGGAFNLHCRTMRFVPFTPRELERGGQKSRPTASQRDLLLAGLEGSMKYNNKTPFQYTDTEMWLNIARLWPGLLHNRLRYGRWLDVLVTHSPPLGIHDEPDRAHTGFCSFLAFMRYFKPRYLLHGHIHLYRHNKTTVTRYGQTEVINVYPYRLLEIEPGR